MKNGRGHLKWYFLGVLGAAAFAVWCVVFVVESGRGNLLFEAFDVGQGDALFIQAPGGNQILVDGGPGNAVLSKLGSVMPFWDRSINLVVLTHPQKDHMQGLISVIDRYSVDYFVRSEVGNDTEGYKKLMDVVERKRVSQKFVTPGERITVGSTSLTTLWPSEEQVAKAGDSARRPLAGSQGDALGRGVLGASIVGDLNDYSVVFWLRYGNFDALFPGDADTHVEEKYRGVSLADGTIELLKVPHHGSKTGMSETYLDWLKPQLAVISVGKNSYGHPAKEVLATLATRAIQAKRTDEEGDIEIISDGKEWEAATVDR